MQGKLDKDSKIYYNTNLLTTQTQQIHLYGSSSQQSYLIIHKANKFKKSELFQWPNQVPKHFYTMMTWSRLLLQIKLRQFYKRKLAAAIANTKPAGATKVAAPAVRA